MLSIDDLKLDFLKEMSNIGLGHSATSLSRMVNATVNISLPKISMIPIENIVGSTDKSICAAKTSISGGEVTGALIIIFNDATSFWLIDKISGNKPGTTNAYDSMGRSAILEFTNIIGGSFLTSLSDFMDYSLMPEVPEIFTGKGTTIKSELEQSLHKTISGVLYVKTDIFVENEKVEGEIYLMLNEESFEKMFRKMNK